MCISERRRERERGEGGGKRDKKVRGDDEVVVYALYPMHENFGSPRVAVIASGEGRKILGSWLVCELTFFMDTDSTGTPETVVYPRYAAYIVLSSRGEDVGVGGGGGMGFGGEGSRR